MELLGGSLSGWGEEGQCGVAFVFDEAAEGNPERVAGLLLEVENDRFVELVVDLEGALEPLVLLVGVDQSLPVRSADYSAWAADNLYLEDVTIEPYTLCRPILFDVGFDDPRGVTGGLLHKLGHNQLVSHSNSSITLFVKLAQLPEIVKSLDLRSLRGL